MGWPTGLLGHARALELIPPAVRYQATRTTVGDGGRPLGLAELLSFVKVSANRFDTCLSCTDTRCEPSSASSHASPVILNSDLHIRDALYLVPITV